MQRKYIEAMVWKEECHGAVGEVEKWKEENKKKGQEKEKVKQQASEGTHIYER